MYSTPINDFVPGVLIHAYTLNTIILGDYINSSPEWLNWLIAICVCIAFISINIFLKDYWSHVGNLVMRILQALLMFGMVFIGAYWYQKHLQYIDFSLIVLVVGFSALATDIYDGIYALYLKIFQMINNSKNK